MRHGESTWNDLNIFTGWADADLNEKGKGEALSGGQLLKEGGFTFDVAYTSVLKRAIKTLWIILEEMNLMYIPIVSFGIYSLFIARCLNRRVLNYTLFSNMRIHYHQGQHMEIERAPLWRTSRTQQTRDCR